MPPIDAARDLLPWWMGWSSGVVFLVAVALVTVLVVGFTGRLTLRGFDPEAHWTERARHAAAARTEAARAFFTVVVLSVIFALTQIGPLSNLGPGVLCLLGFFVSFEIGGYLGLARERRLLGAWLDRRQWNRAGRGLFWLMWSPWLVTMALIVFVPVDGGVGTWVALGAGALLLLWLFDDGAFRVLRMLGLVRAAPPELRAIIDAACAAAGRPPARAQVLESWMTNAFAQPHRDTITFTTRALDVLSRDELLAVAHHEVGHLSERGGARLRRWAVVPLLVSVGAIMPIFTHWGLGGALAVLFAVFVLVTWLTRLSRRSEEAADAHAHDHSGDAAAYVRVLEKLHEHNLGPAVHRGRRRTHPDLWERMAAASVQPEWPRPAPPARLWRPMVGTIFVLVLVVVPGTLGLSTLRATAGREAGAATWLLALTGGDNGALATLGREAFDAGRLAPAAVLFRAANELAPWRVDHGAWLARVRLQQGQPEEAEAILDELAPFAELAPALIAAVRAEVEAAKKR